MYITHLFILAVVNITGKTCGEKRNFVMIDREKERNYVRMNYKSIATTLTRNTIRKTNIYHRIILKVFCHH